VHSLGGIAGTMTRVAVMAGTGQVVLLNGASSAGKSSIAERLLADFETPWFRMAVDAFGAMRAHRQTSSLNAVALADVLHKTRAGFHRAVAGMAMAGNDVVMDHVLSEPWRLADLLEVMAEIDVVLVGVHCATVELVRREAVRGDRMPGTAASQAENVHVHGVYDVEVDTGTSSVEECSARIREHLSGGTPPARRAFDTLRDQRHQ
jgi:chloramphenicol 3-O phosphotransferase